MDGRYGYGDRDRVEEHPDRDERAPARRDWEQEQTRERFEREGTMSGTDWQRARPGAKVKATRGGWRPGAGRKPVLKNRVRFLVDLEQEQLDWLRRTAAAEASSVSGLLRAMIAARMKRRGRKG